MVDIDFYGDGVEMENAITSICWGDHSGPNNENTVADKQKVAHYTYHNEAKLVQILKLTAKQATNFRESFFVTNNQRIYAALPSI